MSYQNRKEIPEQYKWKKEDIFASVKDWEDSFAQVVEVIPNLAKYKGQLNNPDTILEMYKDVDKFGLQLEQLACYAFLNYCEDSKDADAQTRFGKCSSIESKAGEMTSYIDPEMSKLSNEMLQEMIDDKRFDNYTVSLKAIIKRKPHILEAGEEKLLAGASDVTRYFQEAFNRLDSGDLDYGSITVDGQEIKLGHGTYSMCLQHKNQSVRKAAFERFYKPYISQINTISALYEGNVKNNVFVSCARKYNSVMEMSTAGEDVDKRVYENLIESINNSFAPLHEYIALRKKILGLETLNMYDLYVPMFDNADIKLGYEDAHKLVVEGLAPLGKEYQALLRKAKDERWIDVYETPTKRSGAFSLGVKGIHPYVMLNYQQTTHDVFTLAHELGHSMHSYYSCKVQPQAKSEYTIFVAEVASTVNEVLLLNYLLAKEKDVNIKKYLLSYFLDMLRTTMYRQAMFAEFEYMAHTRSENGEPLTSQVLCKDYVELNRKYYGPSVTHNKEIEYEWARIPHFYRAFYVYKYSTGITSAVCIAQKILSEGAPMVEKYKKFLTLGCSMDPVSELKTAGVDLLTKEPFEIVAKAFTDTLAQLKELI
ncbi:MAG: oligoendopeptidase F [Clostridia bacterium]|nr:oligoendopeptidase F [Clostridia bacterium]